MVDGDMKSRYGFLLDRNRGLIKEGKSRAIEADEVAKAVEQAPRPPGQGPGIWSESMPRPEPSWPGCRTRGFERLMAMNAKRLEKLGRR